VVVADLPAHHSHPPPGALLDSCDADGIDLLATASSGSPIGFHHTQGCFQRRTVGNRVVRRVLDPKISYLSPVLFGSATGEECIGWGHLGELIQDDRECSTVRSALTVQAPEAGGLQMSRTVLVYTGRVGDHNDRGMRGAAIVGAALGRWLGVEPTVLGHPEPAINENWDVELKAALPGLRELQTAHAAALAQEDSPVFAWPRCAAAIATLPNVAAMYPDAIVVWLDAHADLNTPENTTTGYLGGLALSASLGWWDSGLGAGLNARNVILGGSRDLDPAEQGTIDAGVIALAAGPEMLSTLDRFIADRPIYFHLDCDVLDPGIMPTDYSVPGGLTLDDLTHVAARLARNRIIGVEIGEFEDHGNADVARVQAERLVSALSPLLV